MLDIALIFSDWNTVLKEFKRLNDDVAVDRLEKILDLEFKRRVERGSAESLQSKRKRLNRAFGKLRSAKGIYAIDKAIRAVMAAKAMQLEDHNAAIEWIDGTATLGEQVEYGVKLREFRNMVFEVVDSRPNDEYESFVTLVQAAGIDAGMLKTEQDFAFSLLSNELKLLRNEVSSGYHEIKEIEEELREHMLWLPNLPHESVPDGKSEEDNKPGQVQGNFREFDFDPKPHWELGPELGIIDFERGVKLAGSRSYVLRGWGRVCSEP